ncbi:TIGR00299 family protein [Methanofervidicoccus sp. A16]|uniref:nickel pincer cofactor biosynthesis protein LarC n=1 Tax=Methanofervidicoccus sp. A16 TaxID=2607662 RepID=UPI00118BB72A|nr:nickel pincer cofactor biosynthesis protein LarC [Methanofervidicoccus sp. A16]AXI25465.1 TIGR00299 family protein [Methanofervidicoccus sp. A16]
MKLLLLDPKISGISGDMLLSALVDLTGDIETVYQISQTIEELDNCKKFKIDIREEKINGIRAKRLHIEIVEDKLKNPQDLKRAMEEVVNKLGLSEKVRKISFNILEDLISAEMKVHGDKNIHLHEISSLDTIFDILGSATLLEKHGYLDGKIYSTPPVLGSGYIQMEHGILPVPTPSTLEILCKYRIKYTNPPYTTNFEHTTPTGIAILVNIVDKIVDSYPEMIPLKVGYGGGSKRLENVPNVLRVVEGRIEDKEENIVVLETNVDDISGEVIGNLYEVLFKRGAKEVFVVNGIGKKNRPTYVITVITDYGNLHRMVETLMEETGTLGVRIKEVDRIKAERRIEVQSINIKGRSYKVRVKVSYLGDKLINIKPEYDDVKKIAEDLNIPLRVVLKEIEKEISKIYRHLKHL